MIPVDDEPYSKTIVIPSSMIGKFRDYRSQLIINISLSISQLKLFPLYFMTISFQIHLFLIICLGQSSSYSAGGINGSASIHSVSNTSAAQ